MVLSRLTTALITLTLLFSASACLGQKKEQGITVVYKDGHQKSFSVADVSRIEFKNDVMVLSHNGKQENIPLASVARMDFGGSTTSKVDFDRGYYAGKWEFGESPGMATFQVTLDADGQAHKSIGNPHGTWSVVDDEARITWDDGWRDVIRKVGGKLQKYAYEPGRSLTGDPSNVTRAKRVSDQTM